MGDMAELGSRCRRKCMPKLGAYAKQKGIAHLFTFGENKSTWRVQAFGENAQHFAYVGSLAGSAYMHMMKNDTLCW